MKKILVSGASTIVGYGILRSLLKSEEKLYLIGTSIYDDSVAEGFCDKFIKAPKTNDANYITWLKNIISEFDIDMIIPGIDADMYAWSENKAQLDNGKVVMLINNLNLISLCKDKWEFYNTLIQKKNNHIIDSSLSANFEELEHKFKLPMILKPRQGFGSKGIVKVYTKEIFENNKQLIGETLMVQPLVGYDDEEYTTSAFCDGKGGFYASMTLKRKLSKDGFTEKAEVVTISGLSDVIKNLCEVFNPIGPTNFQFRLHHGILKLLEINPRISSSTSIRSSFGYNESLMAISYFLEHKDPKQPVIKEGKAVRYIEDFIFYK